MASRTTHGRKVRPTFSSIETITFSPRLLRQLKIVSLQSKFVQKLKVPPHPAASRPPSISVKPHHQIRFRHPHYPDSSNVLLTFFAPDDPAGGIEYSVAHAACGVISGNRWADWFTTTIDGAKSTLTYGDILCERDYHPYLPNFSLETPYAIVPTFKEWTSPNEDLHPCWQTNHNIPSAQNSRLAVISSLSAVDFIRDQLCRMSGFTEGTQAAHLGAKTTGSIATSVAIQPESSSYLPKPIRRHCERFAITPGSPHSFRCP